MRAIAFHPASQTRNTLAAVFGIALSVLLLSGAQAQTGRQRLQAIFAMSAEEMAATSAFTRRAYEAQIAQIYRIQNKRIRDIVLELVRNPAALHSVRRAASRGWRRRGAAGKATMLIRAGYQSIRWSGWKSPTAGSMPTTAYTA